MVSASPRGGAGREEWADTFGLPFWASLPVHRKWGAAQHGSVALMQKVFAAQGSTRDLSLLELLTLGKAEDVPEGWASPFAWFVQAQTHPFEALTVESCEALAAYLARRHAELVRRLGPCALVEVGASNGRLAHHVNATGFLQAPLIATDPQPVPTPSHPKGRFPVEAMDDAAALAAYKPVAIVLCAWMPAHEDWTARWRKARVPEYVLIGECSAKSKAHNTEHPGYERVPLPEVSRHLLHYSDGMPELVERRGKGVCCAVAYRRKQ